MKKNKLTSFYARKHHWWSFAWLAIMAAVLFPQQAKAGPIFVDNPSNYTVNCYGTNTVKIKAPVYNKNGYDTWINSGYVYYREKGSNTKTMLLYWGVGKKDISDGAKTIPVKFRTEAPGNLKVIRGSGNAAIVRTERTYDLSFNGSDYLSAEVEWTVPIDLRGKTLIISWEVKRDGNGRSETKVGIDDKEIEIPAKAGLVDPIVSNAIISQDSAYIGQLLVPWMITVQNDSVVSSKARYKDRNKEWHEIMLETKATGYIYLDASEPHDSLYVVVDYKDDGDLIKNRKSNYYDVPIIHSPINLKATAVDDQNASVKLEWSIGDLETQDYMENDLFQLQRSLSGKEEDYKDITSIPFKVTQENYSFEDKTLLESINTSHLDENGHISPTYRLRRNVSTIWGWSGNPISEVGGVTFCDVSLLTVKNAKGDWEDEKSRTLKVEWEYEQGTDTQWYVWDERAEIKLKVLMFRRDGSLVDTQEYILTSSEIENRTKTITLTRSCVDYQIFLVTDSKDFPILANVKTFDVSSQDDWRNVHAMVEQGRQVNVKLTKDIEINYASDLLIGSEQHPFTGTIDGDGHKLILKETFSLSPFRYVRDAVFKNLTIEGRVQYNENGGFVKNAENVLFQNCRSNVTRPGTGTFGGFVGFGTKIRFVNCLSNINSSNPANNLFGFIQRVNDRNAADELVFTNAVYAPVHPYSNENPFGALSMYQSRMKEQLRTCYVVPKETDEIEYSGVFNQLSGAAEENLAILGDQWMATDEWPFITPKVYVKEQSNVEEHIVGIPKLYFTSNGRVKKNSLNAETRQSSVMLTWQVENGVVDYFQVFRKESTEGDDKWEIIANNISDLGYEDKTVSPIVDSYDYKVKSAVDCEGTVFEESAVVQGFCLHTCKLEGYVRYKDGTGVPGVRVQVTPLEEGESRFTSTDDSGHYEIDLLPYYGRSEVTYNVTPSGFVNSSDKIDLVSSASSFDIKFDGKSNYSEVPDFLVASSYKFSGIVMYNGTTIPVKGANFKVNGHIVHNHNGQPVETDTEGRFSFNVLKGTNRIQCVMDGHEFWQDGWFKGEEGRDDGYYFEDNIAGIYFYDNTTVNLIGRVTGGHVQGDLPLGNSLSHNNLGDSITIVLVLEGDNKSQLVYDNLDPLKNRRDTVFINKAHDTSRSYQTTMVTTRRNVTIYPDPYTGEYSVMLPPVRWKVQQIYATGYPTLFQEGKSSDVIDLTDALTPIHETYEGKWQTNDSHEVTKVDVDYNAIYCRIWHAPTELTYEQLGFNQFGYFGDLSYESTNLKGDRDEVPLAYMIDKDGPKTADNVAYTFGYPVFSVERTYPFRLSAVERYYWNNKLDCDTVDVVHLNGGKVTIHNGFLSSTDTQELELDSLGQGLLPVQTKQVPYLLSEKEALRTLTMTLTMDGTTYEAKPLDAYIMNVYEIPGAPDVISVGQPMLVDILRDPPGGGSSAKLSKGATLKKDYALDMSAEIGMKFEMKNGTSEDCFTGVVTAPQGMGVVYGFNQSAQSDFEMNFDFIVSVKGNRAFSYTMTTSHDISTSSDSKMVGADADVYMGINQDIVVRSATAFRAIPKYQYEQLQGRLKSGRMIVIAQGRDLNDSVFYLVRDEALSVGPKLKSTFTYTQHHILNTIIPSLTKQIQELLFTGTQEEAQAIANKNRDLVYLSLVGSDDPKFGVMNTLDGNYYSYTSLDPDQKDMNYRIIVPSGYDKSMVRDSIYHINQTMLTWISMITQNEKEKMSANDLVNTFDVDGGVGMEYKESFSSDYSNSIGWYVPVVSSATDPYIGDGELGLGEALVSVLGPMASSLVGSLGFMTKEAGSIESNPERPSTFEVNVNFTGSKLTFKMTPVLSYDSKHNATESKSYSREESFSISMDKKNHLNFSVYRVNTMVPDGTALSDLNVFTSEHFYEQVDYNYEFLDRQFDPKKWSYAKSFVYRTNGGATCRPYEPERKTLLYMPGQILDQRTKQIEKPVIRLDKQSVSGVPYGEPARFKVYMANESEAPESAYPELNLSLNDQSNPYGARLTVDGFPVTWNGTEIGITPGAVTEKTLEVYAGDGFDYEGLTLCLMSCEDKTVYDEVSFDVHYLHTAGPVNISTPGDKWVMNTDAPHDKRGYHIPVVIDGFDKNQHNFDHIEFQYKESDRGDDYWTNLCSFYAKDSLYNLASGVKAMIPENGNINTEFYGEGEIIEKAYDLRAVLFCRRGNEFLTTPSKVLSGIKDTRRPQLFGTPEPASGILDIGDNIVFNFSEDIEYNYLSDVVNFEVKGEVNNDNVTSDVSLEFDGESSVETEARRNFNGKDLTVDILIKPDQNGGAMPIFSHGTNGKKLQLWITEEKQLRAVVGDEVFTTDSVIKSKNFTQVALVIKQPQGDEKNCKLALYNGGSIFGEYTLSTPYTGVGPLIFGRTNEADRSQSQFYKGRMMEARLWYRALTSSQVSTIYGEKRLSGYEVGLVDYYPMNEGSGHYALDKTQGANARLYNTSWARPKGVSLHLDFEDKGLKLNPQLFTRTSEEDYTLMFWFKTDSNGRGVLISNGAGLASNVGAKSQYCIGFEAEKLMYRSNGLAVEVPGDYSDNQWHHYAMTVNRAMRVANIYMDASLRATFSTDSLGGITGGYPMLGGAIYQEIRDGKTVELDNRNWLTGNLDEICFFEQALPVTLIKDFMTKSPSGEESGLIAYVSFDRQERQKDNDIVLVPFIYSRKVYRDDDGNIVYVKDEETQLPTTTPKRDNPFDKSLSEETILNEYIDKTDAAPMLPFEDLRNLKFSYVGRGNQIMVNINELDSKLNKRNIYVTLRDIPDKNGNILASPVTASYYVDCSPVRWKENRVSTIVWTGYDSLIWLGIENNSGVKHTYSIENCPEWLTFEHPVNVISPNSNDEVKATVSKNLNVGSYDEIIYLVDENGVSEPLYLTITVEGDEPYWTVSGDMLQHSMNIIGEVTINGEIDTDTRDIVGVFDKDNKCHGVANIDYSEKTGESRVYITVYDNATDKKDLHFILWNYATGLEMLLTPDREITFKDKDVIGADKPVALKAGREFVQNINLKSGWNWVSFNISNEKLFNLNNLLDDMPWKEDDVLTDMNSDVTLIFKNGHWRLSGNVSGLGLSTRSAYAVKVQDDIAFSVAGSIIDKKDDRTITVKQGWNGIGYTPMMNLSVETALSDYYDKAENGDVIKSHTEFAVFQKSNGVGRWKGDLKYMKPGEGYMLLRKKNTKVSFIYPFYEPGSKFLDEAAKAPAHSFEQEHMNTMSLSAVTAGVELEPGDRLVAYADGEIRGMSVMDADSVFYMSVGGESRQPLRFAIEREGEVIAATGEVLMYETNAVIGTPDNPTRLDFVRREIAKEGWYTLDGIKLNGRPVKKGVYIFNGKKKVID